MSGRLATRPTQNVINASKRRMLKELMNQLRPEPFKTVKGYNKLFNTTTNTTYRIMDDLMNTVAYTPEEEKAIDMVKSIYMANKGQTRTFLYIVDGKSVIDHTVDIPSLPEDPFDKWLFYELFRAKFLINSEYTIFGKNSYRGKLYVYSNTSMVNKERIIQSYLDGLSHCVFTPILKWATELRDKQDPEKSTIKKYNAIIKSVEKLAIQYEKGIPETKCNEVCNKLNIQIEINYLFSDETIRYGTDLVKPRCLFRFTNTRANHLDSGNLVHNIKPEVITYNELMEKMDEYDKTKTFYYYKKSHGQINSVSTLTESWTTTTEFNDAKKNLENEYNLQSMYVDDINQKDLSNFIARGTHYNCSIEFPRHEIIHSVNIKCIDQEKAYYNFKKCKYYDGFLGKITDFRKCDRIMGVGLYLITNLRCSDKNNKLYQYNNVMNVYKSNNVYPSPALTFLKDNGFTFDIVAGCYGIERLDFEFGKEMLKKVAKTPYVDEDGNFKMKGSSFYALCTGMWDSRSELSYKYIRGSEDDAQVLKNNSTNSIWYCDGEIRIGVPRKQSNHLGHITSFILEYQRISLFTQLFEMDIKKITNIYVDGIYYADHPFTLLDTFGKKDTDTYSNMIFNTDTFISNLHTDMPVIPNTNPRQNYKTELFLGAGGNGKTHFNLTDAGLVKVVFSSPTHKLNSVKHNELGVKVFTHASLLSENPMLYRTIQQTANVLIIDEVSMMSDEDKNAILQKYSNIKIIMCGDVGYQLPCISQTPFKIEGFEHITTLTKNYRVKCDKLLNVLQNIRNHIDGKEKLNVDIIPKCTVAHMEKMYTTEDIIIARTNKAKDVYTKMFYQSKKWYITKTGKTTNAGEIFVMEEQPENGEIRHAFTAHSIQGETMKNKIFIDYNDIKVDINGLYTAISRAQYLHQIYFIQY
jgi:hypothetical protein